MHNLNKSTALVEGRALERGKPRWKYDPPLRRKPPPAEPPAYHMAGAAPRQAPRLGLALGGILSEQHISEQEQQRLDREQWQLQDHNGPRLGWAWQMLPSPPRW